MVGTPQVELGDLVRVGRRRTLQSSVARLRKALNVDAERLRGRPPGYVLKVAADAVDSRTFAASVEAAGTLGSEDPTTASEMLRRGKARHVLAGELGIEPGCLESSGAP